MTTQPTTEITVASCYIKTGSGWGVSFGDWTQDGPRLDGFASAWDAWAFAVATTGIDPHARLPESVRRSESQPQPDLLDWEPEPEQLSLLQIVSFSMLTNA